MGILFDNQPEWCREPLNISQIPNFNKLNKNIQRLALFDPRGAYDRIDKANAINPFKRYNTVNMLLIFPNRNDGYCSCGCGRKLTGRQTRWASKECQTLPTNVQAVMSGHSHLTSLLRRIFGDNCAVCGISEYDSHKTHELDHKYPVKFGGGGGWLGNYEFKCPKCHREKTNKDFGFKQKLQHPELF